MAKVVKNCWILSIAIPLMVVDVTFKGGIRAGVKEASSQPIVSPDPLNLKSKI